MEGRCAARDEKGGGGEGQVSGWEWMRLGEVECRRALVSASTGERQPTGLTHAVSSAWTCP
jgi:hypothetical protein